MVGDAGVVGVSDEIKVRPLASSIVARSEIEAARNRYAQETALRISVKARKS